MVYTNYSNNNHCLDGEVVEIDMENDLDLWAYALFWLVCKLNGHWRAVYFITQMRALFDPQLHFKNLFYRFM